MTVAFTLDEIKVSVDDMVNAETVGVKVEDYENVTLAPSDCGYGMGWGSEGEIVALRGTEEPRVSVPFLKSAGN